MKHFHTLLLAVCTAWPVSGVVAQGPSPLDPPTQTWARTDRVLADLSTPAPERTKRVFIRTASLNADGSYLVRVLSPEGVLRMEGNYLDQALTVPHGTFAYYHSNGRMESTGSYEKGIKTGEWQCWTITGEARAARAYTGLPWEEMQFVVGVAERARHIPSANTVVAIF